MQENGMAGSVDDAEVHSQTQGEPPGPGFGWPAGLGHRQAFSRAQGGALWVRLAAGWSQAWHSGKSGSHGYSTKSNPTFTHVSRLRTVHSPNGAPMRPPAFVYMTTQFFVHSGRILCASSRKRSHERHDQVSDTPHIYKHFCRHKVNILIRRCKIINKAAEHKPTRNHVSKAGIRPYRHVARAGPVERSQTQGGALLRFLSPVISLTQYPIS